MISNVPPLETLYIAPQAYVNAYIITPYEGAPGELHPYEYDANRNRTLVRFGEAVEGRQPTNIVRTTYDERDLTFQITRAEGDPHQSTTQYDYDGNRNVTKVSEGLEDDPRVTINAYDGYNRLVATSDPMGNVTSNEYDENDNRVRTVFEGELDDVLGGAGNSRLADTTFVYDPMDRLERVEAAFFDPVTQAPIGDGLSIAQTVYSDNSQVLEVVNDNNNATTSSYDTANRVQTVTDAKGNTATYAYDENSNVTTITEVDQSDTGGPDQSFTTSHSYDNLDRIIRTVDSVGNTTDFAHDSMDNQTVTVDALDHEIRYVYDGMNRLLRTIRDMDGDGTDSATVPGDGDPDIVTSQAWDDTSRLTGQTDDNGNTTGYAYDALNRQTAEVYADQTAQSYTYDVHDSRITMTDADGSTATCQYDDLDRLVRKDITVGPGVSDSTSFEAYRYDGLSRLIQAEDDDSVVTQRYDSLSNIIEETLNGKVTTSGFDGVGNLVQTTYPGGRTIATTFDELERKKTITDVGTGQMVASYDYVGPGRVERREYGNGTQTHYTYDGITGVPNEPDDFGVRRIVRTRHTRIDDGAVLDDRTFKWDRLYNKTQRADVRAGGPQFTHDYAYDNIYRLIHTQVTDPGRTVLRDTVYDLDGVGNRKVVIGNPDDGEHVGPYQMLAGPSRFDREMNQYSKTPTEARAYDRNGNLIVLGAGDADGSGGVDLVDHTAFAACMGGPATGIGSEACAIFDIDGSRTIDLADFAGLQLQFASAKARSAVISYDYRNRMVEYVDLQAGQRHTYAYDALGRRIAKIVDADGVAAAPVETRFYLHGWQEIEEQDAAGATLATYVHGLYIDEVLNMQRSFTPPTEPDCVPPPAGLVSWWPLDEFGGSASCDPSGPGPFSGYVPDIDTAGLAAHGCAYGTPEFIPGVVGTALSFDGIDDGVSVPHSEELALDEFTVMFRANPSSVQDLSTDGHVILVDKDHDGWQETGWYFQGQDIFTPDPDDWKIAFGLFTDAADPAIRVGGLFDNKWHLLVGTYAQSTASFYVDGKLAGTVGGGGMIGRTGQPMHIGWRTGLGPDFAGQHFRGEIDELAIFNRALDPAEIAAIFAARSSGMCSGGLGGNHSAYGSWTVSNDRNSFALPDGHDAHDLRDGKSSLAAQSVSPPSWLRGSVASWLDFYYHTDDLYNVMALSDADGNVVERYEYADYGQPLDSSSLRGSVPPSLLGNPYLFTGRENDPETGWYHFRTRYLDAINGRFISRDVIGLWEAEDNLGSAYAYTGNGPQSFVDPFGEDTWGSIAERASEAWDAAKKEAGKAWKAARKQAKKAWRKGEKCGCEVKKYGKKTVKEAKRIAKRSAKWGKKIGKGIWRHPAAKAGRTAWASYRLGEWIGEKTGLHDWLAEPRPYPPYVPYNPIPRRGAYPPGDYGDFVVDPAGRVLMK